MGALNIVAKPEWDVSAMMKDVLATGYAIAASNMSLGEIMSPSLSKYLSQLSWIHPKCASSVSLPFPASENNQTQIRIRNGTEWPDVVQPSKLPCLTNNICSKACSVAHLSLTTCPCRSQAKSRPAEKRR